MIIPIGHESGTVRRHPWITYGLIVACIGVFLHTRAERTVSEEAAGEALQEAVEYLVEHPYLELPAALDPLLRSPDLVDQRELWLAIQEEAEEEFGFIPAFALEAEQAELDGLVGRTLALREQHPFRRLGLIPAEPDSRRAFTHLFVHGDEMHLIGNLFLLFLTGPFIEDVWGRPIYVVFYLLAGLAGAGLFVGRFPDVTLPLIGASGAIAGCMGAFLVRHGSTRIRFFYWFGLFAGTFSAPAWLMLPLWFGSELLMARLGEAFAGAGGVAYWAHVGGFAFGATFALAMRALRIEERFIHPQLEAKVTVAANAGVAKALRAQDEGRHEEAFTGLMREARRTPANPEAIVALWGSAVRLGRVAEAAPHLLRLIRQEVRSEQGDLATQHWAEFAGPGRDVPVEPGLLFHLVPLLMRAKQRDLAANALERILDSDGVDAAAALRVARVARPLDPAIALRAATRALEDDGLGAAERRECQTMVAQLQAAAAARRPAAAPKGTASVAPENLDHGLRDLDAESPAPVPEPGPAPAPADPEAGSLELEEGGTDSIELDGGSALATAEAEALDYGSVDLGVASAEPDADGPALRTLQVRDGVPLALGEHALSLDAGERGKIQLPLAKVEAVAVAAVRDLGARPVVVVDLVLNWADPDGAPLRVVRLRSDRFNPIRLVAGAESPLEALRTFVTRLIDATGAHPLPDAAAARGEPTFSIFPELAAYHRDVLCAESS